MFDVGKFFNDIGSNVNSFFNPKKKRDEQPRPVVNRPQPQMPLVLNKQGQQQWQQQHPQAAPVAPSAPVAPAGPDFSNKTQLKVEPIQQKPVQAPQPAPVVQRKPAPNQAPPAFQLPPKPVAPAPVAPPAVIPYKPGQAPGQQLPAKPKPAPYNPKRNSLEYLPKGIGEVSKFVGDTGVAIAHGVASAPERLVRSVFLEPAGTAIANATGAKVERDRYGNVDFSQQGKKSTIFDIPGSEGLASFLYGDDPIKTYQQSASDARTQMEGSDTKVIRDLAPAAPFLQPVLAAADATAFSGLAPAGKAILKGSEKFIDDAGNKIIRVLGRDKPPVEAPMVTPHGVPVAEKKLTELPHNRPNDEIQTKIEQANAAGDKNKVGELIEQLPAEDKQAMQGALGIPTNTKVIVDPVTKKIIRVPDETKPTGPQNIADLLPGIEDYKARTSGAAVDPLKELAEKHGVQPATIDRLTKDYGESATRNLLARTSDASNIKNKDGFVISEAQKQFGKPVLKQKVPDNVNPQTGEIIEPVKAPAAEGTYSEHIQALPAVDDVTGEEARQLIGTSQQKLQTGLQNVDSYLRRNGSDYESFSRDIQNANRNGVEPSALHADVYNKYLKPALDKTLEASGKTGVGEQKYYLPQVRAGADEQPVKFGSSLVNKLDTEDFGFAKGRENKLLIDEMAHDPATHSRYATQAVSERYRKALEADQVIKDVHAENGVTLTPQQAHHVVNISDTLAGKLAQAADNGGLAASGTEKINLVDDLAKLGEAKGTPKFVIDQGLSRARRTFSSSDELYTATYTDAKGAIKSIGEGSGYNRYNNADGIGNTLQESAYQNGVLDEDILATDFIDHLKGAGLTDDQLDEAVSTTINKLHHYDDMPAENLETVAQDRAQIIARTEKNVAREQMSKFLEGADIKSAQLKKNINDDAKKLLIQDRAKDSLAQKLTNGATGTIYRGALGYNPVSALQNVTELRRAYAQFGEKNFAEAIAKTAKDPKITQRYGIKEIVASHAAKDGKIETVKPHDLLKPMGMFNATESIKDAVLLHGFEKVHKAAGLKGTDLTDAVLKDFNKLSFKGGKGGSLGFNKSKTGRLLGQFMQYQIKDWKLTGNKAMEAIGRHGADEATKKAAQAYLARKVPADIATYLVLNAAYGASIGTVMNFQNPFAQQFLDSGAGGDEKAVGYATAVGGPIPGIVGDMYLAVRKAYRDAEVNGDTVDLQKLVNARLRKDAALLVPGGNQLLNKTGIQHAFGDNIVSENLPQGFLGDTKRGYNKSVNDKARFATPEYGDTGNMLRGLITGTYTTDQAREYFGTKGIAGDLFPGQKYNPVSKPYQDKIDPQSKILTDPHASEEQKHAAHGEIIRLINSARDDQDLRTDFFKKNPDAAATYKEMTATKYNPETRKNESDVISPERYNFIQSDKSGKLYDFLKKRAEKNNQEFGQPIDPLYQLKDKAQRNEVLALRAAYTGDDRERKATLRNEPWFQDYEKNYDEYINKKLAENTDAKSDFGSTPRAQAYFELSQSYPQKDGIIAEYEGIRNSDPDAGKQYYKTHADELSAAYDAHSAGALDWTNKMRMAEGAEPLSAEVWDNATYGYNDNEESLAKRLSYKYGTGYKPNYRSGGGSGGSSGSSRGTTVGLKAASFGRTAAAPTVKITKSKSVAIKRKAKASAGKQKSVKIKKT